MLKYINCGGVRFFQSGTRGWHANGKQRCSNGKLVGFYCELESKILIAMVIGCNEDFRRNFLINLAINVQGAITVAKFKANKMVYLFYFLIKPSKIPINMQIGYPKCAYTIQQSKERKTVSCIKTIKDQIVFLHIKDGIAITKCFSFRKIFRTIDSTMLKIGFLKNACQLEKLQTRTYLHNFPSAPSLL